ncbi:oxidoreductase [candidate division BRC1 bacterium HGW-BRC1-1]|jgi:predicted dehydrogenase|nr:MAG: oxidoreductase [candidate division BRC1 bacterium HGW-BRC1-1]
MTNELLIGVIGAGGRGAVAHYAHNPQDGVRLVAGADTDPAALERFRGVLGADTFVTADYRELLARPEIGAVFVATPDHLHEEHAVAALKAGKHVYLEKPMAITVTGCDRILRTAMECGRRLYVGHNMRHMTVIQKMKEIIDSGRIGEVKAGWCRHFIAYGGDAYFKDWHADRARSTSLLLQKGAHDIDILHWLCGGFSRRVTAVGGLTVYDRITDRHDPSERGFAGWSDANWPPLSQTGLNPVMDVEDISMMLMELDNGVFASYQQCHYTPDAWRNYTVIGTEGRIENLGDNPGECMVALWNKRGAYKPQGDEQFPIAAVGGSHGGADPAIVAEFVRFAREGGATTTSPIAARNSVAAGYCAAHSLRNGSVPVDVPPVDAKVAEYFAG